MLGAVSARRPRNAVICMFVASLMFASAATAAGSDSNGSANGQGLNSYGGSWHVVPTMVATVTGS